MHLTTLNRRSILAGGAAVLALAPLRHVRADPSPAEASLTAGDWFAQVKAQHELITWLLTQLISGEYMSTSQRGPGLKRLTTIFVAHSVAEENVLYPALATHGYYVGSEELYLEQDAQKVVASVVNMEAMGGASEEDVVSKLKELQQLVLPHAHDHEEQDLFPKLHELLSNAQNAALSQNYQQFFTMIQGI